MTLRRTILLALTFVIVAVLRIVIAYGDTSQGFDEPAHIACGLEWLERGTYTLDPLHPPLSRVAIGLPLFLAGERLGSLPPRDSVPAPFWVAGNQILFGDGHYVRNLALARSGILPFFVLAGVVVFLWTRREFGNFAAVMAVLLFTTTPIVLAFSGLAYTDFPAASTQLLALFAISLWLQAPSPHSTAGAGLAVGLAVLSKFTTLLFLPAAALAIFVSKLLLNRKSQKDQGSIPLRARTAHLLALIVIAVLVTWAGYRFSTGRVDESMNLSPASMPSFQHFPTVIGGLARTMIVRNPVIPAPALFRGIADSWVMNVDASEAYLLGRKKAGGWWYFFLAALLVKLPIPFLLLSLGGLVHAFRMPQWTSVAPALAAVVILLITTGVKHDAGLRHILVVIPLLAIVGGEAAARLCQHRQPLARIAIFVLLCWLGFSSFRARNDYIAWFNELAGREPARILITGCDLDCGQDMLRLSREVAAKQITQISVAAWTTADLTGLGMKFHVLQPFEPVTGWVALSVRSEKLGDAFHSTYPPAAFAWLSAYQPVKQIGRTIHLYYIPASVDNQVR
jgi:hypothetical protein